MSAAKQSVAELAADACAMPWEDKAPFSARYAFKEAVTPELFTELLEALRPFANYACSPAGQCECHNCRARDAIGKAAGSAP
jgi:hypothetical protein